MARLPTSGKDNGTCGDTDHAVQSVNGKSQYGLPWFFRVYFGTDVLPAAKDYTQDQYVDDLGGALLADWLEKLIAEQHTEAEIDKMVHNT